MNLLTKSKFQKSKKYKAHVAEKKENKKRSQTQVLVRNGMAYNY